MLTLVIGCSKSEAPKPETPAATPGMTQPATSAPTIPTPSRATPAEKEALAKGQALFELKCSQCHALGRVTSRTETKEKWAEIVKKMQGKPGSGISDAEAENILGYLSVEHTMESEGRAIFEQKCSQCHGLGRVHTRTETKKKWEEIVKKMREKGGAGISDADAAKILEFISTEHRIPKI
jgi:mono/diheme cytochrome c family protein